MDPEKAGRPALPDRFELLEELGRGGMGVVYRARERATGREVALKVLGASVDTDLLLRFQREGEAAAALSHPGIVGVHDAGGEGGRPWLACELVEGARPLDEAWADLPRDGRVRLVRDAAHALGHAHARGVVHRDVKAANLLVGHDGRVRVADFGLALVAGAERLTVTGAVLGTPHAMAPEQVTGDRAALGPATDVWALGVVLYQALTDRLPFPGQTFTQVGQQVLGSTPPAPRALDPTIPAALEAVCLRALARDPAARWPDGEALARGLEMALRGGGPVAGGSTRLLVVAALAAVGLLALLLARPGATPGDGTAPVRSAAAAPPTGPTPSATEPSATAPPAPDPDDPLLALDATPEQAPNLAGLPPPDRRALDLARSLALDDPNLTFVVGWCLVEGAGGYQRDVPAGLELIQRSAEAGQGRASVFMGDLHRRGRHLKLDLAAARAWYRRCSAEAGEANGMLALSMMLGWRPEAPGDPQEGLRWALRAGREQRHRKPRTCGLVARFYESPPPGLPRDPGKAVPWLVCGAMGGDVRCMRRLGELLAAGEPDRAPQAARHWLTKAVAAKEAPPAEVQRLEALVATLPPSGPRIKELAKGIKVEPGVDAIARRERHMAIDRLTGPEAVLARRECLDAHGCAVCCASIGRALAGAPRIYDRALATLYLQAAKDEEPDVAAAYAWQAGALGLESPEQTRTLLREAAARPRDGDAIAFLARHLVDVEPIDPIEARRLVETTTRSSTRLRSLRGRLRASGTGGPRDVPGAEELLRSAADSGDEAAMRTLAGLLQTADIAPITSDETPEAWRAKADLHRARAGRDGD